MLLSLELIQYLLYEGGFADPFSAGHKGQMLSVNSAVLLFGVEEFDEVCGEAGVSEAGYFDLWGVGNISGFAEDLKFLILSFESKTKEGEFGPKGFYLGFDNSFHG